MKNKIRCIVVDDEPLAIQLLEEHIKQIAHLELVATSDNAIEALKIIKEDHIDLVFLDIQMPVLTGMELVRTLQNPPGIIFTTAYRDYAVESYELNVVDYLLKPITFIRFLKAVNKFVTAKGILSAEKSIDSSEEVNKKSLYVNVNKRYVKVIFERVKYIESVKDYIHIHTNEETIITKEKISEFENKLPTEFMRIHRSFIVNRTKITAFTAQDVEIDDKEIPIGASYKEEVLKTLK